jgi:hypothetical protein
MLPHPDSRLLPVGPGAAPTFASDPEAWFGWIDALLSAAPERVREIGPVEPWADREGHRWRIVATHDGPEIRPGLENPFLVTGELPIITALLVTPTHLGAEVTMRRWRQVMWVPVGSVRVYHLGVAMLARYELPHEAIDRIPPDAWRDAVRRWREHYALPADADAPPASRIGARGRLND